MSRTATATTEPDTVPSRRKRRAHTAPMAVGYQLLHLREKLDLEAIVVADDVGVVLSYAGNRHLATLLADSSMWRRFSGCAIDDMTLARIREHYPYVDLEHVASEAIGPAGVSIVAVSPSWACRVAVQRAKRGILRICTDTSGTGPSFLDPAACAPVPTPDVGRARESSVSWAIGCMY